MKRVLIIFALMFFLFPIISAESCTIVERASCTGGSYPIMGLSNTTNAHGELLSENYYPYVLCCDFGAGDTTCSGANKIIGLESVANSHAEIPSLSSYTNRVCYENLVCSNKASCGSSEIGVLSLPATTNAHIGKVEDYGTKICCSGVCDSGEELVGGNCIKEITAHWEDTNGNPISQKSVLVDYTQVKLILENSRLSSGASVTFNIYEVDTLSPDDLIKTIVGTVDGSENAEVTWTITQANLDKGFDFLEGTELDELYFEVISETSNLLTITIASITGCGYVGLCGDYLNQEECGEDICSAAEFSAESTDSSIVCGSGYNCACEWVNSSNSCSSVWTGLDSNFDADGDIDGDGILNINDADMDGDGILNGDDPDVNGDGIPDGYYVGIDPDGDIDGDGILNINDADMDGDGIPNLHDPDFDGDGIPDGRYADINSNGDIDGDGILNINDPDMDGDGILNGHDPDFDGDGVLDSPFDSVNANGDIDEDGILNINDADMDGDGILNGDDPDFDGDGDAEQFIETSFRIGKCSSSSSSVSDDCEDGFLSYAWTSNWTWDVNNTFHYDPNGKALKCLSGSKTVPCPAQIRLPFFGMFNLLFAAFIVGFVYFLIERKKTR